MESVTDYIGMITRAVREERMEDDVPYDPQHILKLRVRLTDTAVLQEPRDLTTHRSVRKSFRQNPDATNSGLHLPLTSLESRE